MSTALRVLIVGMLLVPIGVAGARFGGWTPKPVKTDVLVRMPGTQPGQGVVVRSSQGCLGCHGGYDLNVEPAFHWKGSMMAQAARDPIFWACLTVAAQDAIWAVGNPNATDLCLRCHFPGGWLEGRSDPTNASLMRGEDYDGMACDFCHRLYDPFAKTTFAGTREGNDWSGYWDEKGNTGPGSNTLSQNAATQTYGDDRALFPTIKRFSGQPFFANDLPVYPTYAENVSGQYFVTPNDQSRGPFADVMRRRMYRYSRHHKSRYTCGTCHDVSNPVLANLNKPLPDLSGGRDPISEQYTASRYYHVERTFSEFMLSAYGRGAGAATNPEFQAQGAPTVTWVAKCQDCHMRDVTGRATAMHMARVRPTQSTEHPKSGLALHDLTGGNSWISRILASLDPNGPVYDAKNAQILGRGPNVLTLDLSAGESPVRNGAALKAGADRAALQHRLAATLKDLTYDPVSGRLGFKVQNNTGHKLISGFPEGRRMFVNIRAYSGNAALIDEVNPYADNVGTLKGLPNSPSSPPLGPNERYADDLVYEMKHESSLTQEPQTFHFVLATGRYKDNRIPPRGFDIANAPVRQCEPAWRGAAAPGYFTAAEYAGGHDAVNLTIAKGAAKIVISLYYQGTSREYVEFLRDEINGTKKTLPASAYIAQTDPFFSRLKAWGNTMWDLWYHNHGLDSSGARVAGIVPAPMTQATYVVPTLTHTGVARPGNTIQIRIAGQPGAPVTWAVSLNPQVQNPPLALPGVSGLFHLQAPFHPIPLGPIDPSGMLSLSLRLPVSLPTPSVFPTQALVDTALTNLHVVTVN